MELKGYLKSCSRILFEKLCELCKDKKLVELYMKYDQNLATERNVDHTWSLISTALLLSENLWKNESVYNNISEDAITNIIDILNDGELPLKDNDSYTNSCLLDSNNNIANPININEVQSNLKLDELDMMEYQSNKKKDYNKLDSFEQSRLKLLDDIFQNDVYGCNEALLLDGVLDYRKFIIRVRHALAHSNYEIIDNNFIRLYHYNKEKKQLDFNVLLNKKLVITILDELNEAYYKSGKAFTNKWYDFQRQYVYDNTKILDDKDVLNQLLLYDVFSEKDCHEILLKAKCSKDYDESANSDKLNIIYELFLEKIRPVCSYGIIVNEFLYGNNKGLIDEEYYEKLDIYNYFNSELFDINMDSNSKEYNKHMFELLLFSFLNSTLLNGVNINENEVLEPIDFSAMVINSEFLLKASTYTKRLETDINNRIIKLSNEIERLNESIIKKQDNMCKNEHINNNYYKEKLPLLIFDNYKKRAQLKVELNYLKQSLQISDITNLSNFILTHLRNSLAHGYIKVIGDINLGNISEIVLEFSDYNPANKTELTFKGNIKLLDLLEILTNKRYINNVINSKNIIRNK